MIGRCRTKMAERSSEELKNHILAVARKHFAMHGFNGLSLKDVAGEAKVANSLINYHFKDKEGLFRACIETFARNRTEALSRILSPPRNAEELRLRIELFVEEMQTAVMADRNNFEIIDREMRSGNPIILDVFENTMLSTFKLVIEFLKNAQSTELVDPDLDPMILATFLFTTTCDAARKDFLAKRFFNVSFEDAAYRRKYATHVATIFLKGVMK